MEKTFVKLNDREFKVVETVVVEKTVDYKEVMSQKEKLLSEQAHEDIMRASMIADFDKKKAFKTLQMDKKKQAQGISYVLLQKIGKGVIQPLSFAELETILNQF